MILSIPQGVRTEFGLQPFQDQRMLEGVRRDGASRIDADSRDCISAVGGTVRDGIAFNIRSEVGSDDGVGSNFLVFQCSLRFGSVELAQVVNARILLGSGARFHKIGNRDGSKQTDDRDHDHDLDKCKGGSVV